MTTTTRYTLLDRCLNESFALFAQDYTPNSEMDVSKSNLVPLTLGRINTRLGKPKLKTIRVLLDSGRSSTVIQKEFVKNLCVKHCLHV